MAFPYSIPVLDSFTGSGSLSGSWGSWPSSFYATTLTMVSDEARANTSAPSSNRWTTSFAADQGAYVSVGFNGGGVSAFGGIFIRANGSTDTHGYQLAYITSGNVLRIDVGGSTIATTTQAIAQGDSIGIEAIGTAIKAYYKASGGSWIHVTALDVTDATINATGYAGMFQDTGGYCDDFAAGVVTRSPGWADVTVIA